jgi:AraC-like DNA-binding protein
MSTKHTLYIENMVCDRCKTAVRQLITQLGGRATEVELGRVTAWLPNTGNVRDRLSEQLSTLGFRLRQGEGSFVSRIKGFIIKYVYEDIKHGGAPLSQLISADIGQSYSHLSRLFSQEEGRTISDFYRAHRIERGKQLLVQTQEPVSTIAYRLNYGSGGRFTAAFREITGLSPTAFRELGQYAPHPLDEL